MTVYRFGHGSGRRLQRALETRDWGRYVASRKGLENSRFAEERKAYAEIMLER